VYKLRAGPYILTIGRVARRQGDDEMMTTAKLIEVLAGEIEGHAKAATAKISRELNVNPLYALEHADDAFRAAAELEIKSFVTEWLQPTTPKTDLEIFTSVREYCLQRLCSLAGMASNLSTSPLTNYANQCRMVSYSSMVERLARIANLDGRA
jgi:hypothetical protein